MSTPEAARTSVGSPSPQGLTDTTITANSALSNVSSIRTTQTVTTQNRAIEATTSTTPRTESATTTMMIESTTHAVSTTAPNMTSKPNGGSVPTTKAGILPTGPWEPATEVRLLPKSTLAESGLRTTSRVPASETVEAKSSLATPKEIEKQTKFMADAITTERVVSKLSTPIFSFAESPATVDNESGQTLTVASTLQMTNISSSSVEATEEIEEESKTTISSSTSLMKTVALADTASAARSENFTEPSAHEEWISTQSSLATHEDEGERTSTNGKFLSLEHTTGQTSSSIGGNEMHAMSSTTSESLTWQSSTITEDGQEESSSTVQTTPSSMNMGEIAERTSPTGEDDKHDLLSTPLILSPSEATDSTTIQSSSATQRNASSKVTEEIVAETSPITEGNQNVPTSKTLAVANTESPEQVTDQSPSAGADNETHPVLSATFSYIIPPTSSATEKDRPKSSSTVRNRVPSQTTEDNTQEPSSTTGDSEIRAVSSTKLSFTAAIIAATQESTIGVVDSGGTSIEVTSITPSVTAVSSSSLSSVEKSAEKRSTVTEDSEGASRSPTRQTVSPISIDHNIVQASMTTGIIEEESSTQELFSTEMTSTLSTTADYIAVHTPSITKNDQEKLTSTRPVAESSQNAENITEQLSSTTEESEIRAVVSTTADHLTTETSVTNDENHVKLPSATVIISLALVSTTRAANSEETSMEMTSITPSSSWINEVSREEASSSQMPAEQITKQTSTIYKDGEETSSSQDTHAVWSVTMDDLAAKTATTIGKIGEELSSTEQTTEAFTSEQDHGEFPSTPKTTMSSLRMNHITKETVVTTLENYEDSASRGYTDVTSTSTILLSLFVSSTVESAEEPWSTNKKDEAATFSSGIHAASRITVDHNIMQKSMTTENAEEELVSNRQTTTSSTTLNYIETPALMSTMDDQQKPSFTAQVSVPSTHMRDSIVRTSTDSAEGVGEFSFSAQTTMSSTAIEESTKRTSSTKDDDGSDQLSTRLTVTTSNLADSETEKPSSTTQNAALSTSVEEIVGGTLMITNTDQNNPTVTTLVLMSSKSTDQIPAQSSSTSEESEMLSDLSTRPDYNRKSTSSIKEHDSEKTSSTALTSVPSTTMEEIVIPISSSTRKDQEEAISTRAATEPSQTTEEITTKQPPSTTEGSETRLVSSTAATSVSNGEDRAELTSTSTILSSTPVSAPSQSTTMESAEKPTSPSDIHTPSRTTVFDHIMQSSMTTENVEKELLSDEQTTTSSATSDYIPKQVLTSTENDQEGNSSTTQTSVLSTTIRDISMPTSSNNEKGKDDTTSTRVTTAPSQTVESITQQPSSTTKASEIDALSKTTVDHLATEISATSNGRSTEEASSLKMAGEQVTKQPSTINQEDAQAQGSTNMDHIIGETSMTTDDVAEESLSGKQTTVTSTAEKYYGELSSTVMPNVSPTTTNHINTETAVITRENHRDSPATEHSGVLSTVTPVSLSLLSTVTEGYEGASHPSTRQTASSTIVDHNISETFMTTDITEEESSNQELFSTEMTRTLSTTMDHIGVHTSPMTESDRKESSSTGVLLTIVGEITLPTSTRVTAVPSQIAEGITQKPASTTATSATNGEDRVELSSTSTSQSSTHLSSSTIVEHNIIETFMTTDIIDEGSSSKELFSTQTTSPLSTGAGHIAANTSSTMKGDQGETTVTEQTTVSSTERESVMGDLASPTTIMDNITTKTLSSIGETNAIPSSTPMTTISSTGMQTSVTTEGAHPLLSSPEFTTNSALVHQTTNKIDQGSSSAITSSKIIGSSTTDASRAAFSSIFTSRENVPRSSIQALSTNTLSSGGNRNDF